MVIDAAASCKLYVTTPQIYFALATSSTLASAAAAAGQIPSSLLKIIALGRFPSPARVSRDNFQAK